MLQKIKQWYRNWMAEKDDKGRIIADIKDHHAVFYSERLFCPRCRSLPEFVESDCYEVGVTEKACPACFLKWHEYRSIGFGKY